MAMYTRHLERQYRDRSEYWALRAQARMGQLLPNGEFTLNCIVDGLDHGKMRFPRTSCLCSKDYSSFVRPALDLTAAICHGRSVHLMASQPFICKDSSLTADITMHVLHTASLQVDLRSCAFHLQADNTVRETKNNTTLRLLSILVSSHRLKRACLNCRQSGHSHEDVDAFLALVANRIQASKEILDQREFCQNLSEWLADKSIRKYEDRRQVHLISAVRDWTLCQELPQIRLWSLCNFDK